MNIEHLIENPGKSETYSNVEKTIANQMARFTKAFTNSTDPIESLKMVCALGMDLWKTCGKKVCEDTNMTLAHIIRQQDIDLSIKFQEIANNANNNDICIYLYMGLPTINNDLSEKSLKELCYKTINQINKAYTEITFMTNFYSIDVDNVGKLYEKYLIS